MRARVRRQRIFLWARPETRESAGEILREAEFERLVTAAAYPLPETERATAFGIIPEGGFLLVLPPDSEVRAGDLLKEAIAPDTVYAVTEKRVYPAHAEAVIRRIIPEKAGGGGDD